MTTEVNSTSTLTEMTKKEDTDPFKSVGSLTFRIDNFREFSNSPSGEETSMRHCDAKVSVRGLTFGLTVYPVLFVSNQMGIIVKCENASGLKGDGSWSCLASVTLQINSLLKSGKDEIYKYAHKFFSSKEKSSLEWEDYEPWDFDDLMDPERGLYNEKEDTLELIVGISVDTPVGIIELPKTDAIQVNEIMVFFNKNLLAAHSRYFHSMFYNGQFDEGKSGEYKVTIEAPATVGHFERMLATMYPENKPLDDQCIEGVLHLANRFLVTDVEGKCLEFLREKSDKTALFKYRMADKYGCTALETYMLRNLKRTDFEKELFKANIAEYNQLGSRAAEAFMARYDELFASESESDEDE